MNAKNRLILTIAAIAVIMFVVFMPAIPYDQSGTNCPPQQFDCQLPQNSPCSLGVSCGFHVYVSVSFYLSGYGGVFSPGGGAGPYAVRMPF